MKKLFNKLIFGTTSSHHKCHAMSYRSRNVFVGFDRAADICGPTAGMRVDNVKIYTTFYFNFFGFYKSFNLFSV